MISQLKTLTASMQLQPFSKRILDGIKNDENEFRHFQKLILVPELMNSLVYTEIKKDNYQDITTLKCLNISVLSSNYLMTLLYQYINGYNYTASQYLKRLQTQMKKKIRQFTFIEQKQLEQLFLLLRPQIKGNKPRAKVRINYKIKQLQARLLFCIQLTALLMKQSKKHKHLYPLYFYIIQNFFQNLVSQHFQQSQQFQKQQQQNLEALQSALTSYITKIMHFTVFNFMILFTKYFIGYRLNNFVASKDILTKFQFVYRGLHAYLQFQKMHVSGLVHFMPNFITSFKRDDIPTYKKQYKYIQQRLKAVKKEQISIYQDIKLANINQINSMDEQKQNQSISTMTIPTQYSTRFKYFVDAFYSSNEIQNKVSKSILDNVRSNSLHAQLFLQRIYRYMSQLKQSQRQTYQQFLKYKLAANRLGLAVRQTQQKTELEDIKNIFQSFQILKRPSKLNLKNYCYSYYILNQYNSNLSNYIIPGFPRNKTDLQYYFTTVQAATTYLRQISPQTSQLASYKDNNVRIMDTVYETTKYYFISQYDDFVNDYFGKMNINKEIINLIKVNGRDIIISIFQSYIQNNMNKSTKQKQATWQVLLKQSLFKLIPAQYYQSPAILKQFSKILLKSGVRIMDINSPIGKLERYNFLKSYKQMLQGQIDKSPIYNNNFLKQQISNVDDLLAEIQIQNWVVNPTQPEFYMPNKIERQNILLSQEKLNLQLQRKSYNEKINQYVTSLNQKRQQIQRLKAQIEKQKQKPQEIIIQQLQQYKYLALNIANQKYEVDNSAAFQFTENNKQLFVKLFQNIHSLQQFQKTINIFFTIVHAPAKIKQQCQRLIEEYKIRMAKGDTNLRRTNLTQIINANDVKILGQQLIQYIYHIFNKSKVSKFLRDLYLRQQLYQSQNKLIQSKILTLKNMLNKLMDEKMDLKQQQKQERQGKKYALTELITKFTTQRAKRSLLKDKCTERKLKIFDKMKQFVMKIYRNVKTNQIPKIDVSDKNLIYKKLASMFQNAVKEGKKKEFKNVSKDKIDSVFNRFQIEIQNQTSQIQQIMISSDQQLSNLIQLRQIVADTKDSKQFQDILNKKKNDYFALKQFSKIKEDQATRSQNTIKCVLKQLITSSAALHALFKTFQLTNQAIKSKLGARQINSKSIIHVLMTGNKGLHNFSHNHWQQLMKGIHQCNLGNFVKKQIEALRNVYEQAISKGIPKNSLANQMKIFNQKIQKLNKEFYRQIES